MNDSDIKLEIFRVVDQLSGMQLRTCHQMIKGLVGEKNTNQQSASTLEQKNPRLESDMEITDLDALDPRQKDPQWFAMDKLTGQEFHETEDKRKKDLMNPF